MKKPFPAIVASLLISMSAAGFAQAQDIQQRGREIVNEAIEALGGDRFLHVTTRVEQGRLYSFYNRELNGLAAATIYARYIDVGPDKAGSVLAVQERQAYGKDEDYYSLIREEGGWEVTYRGPADLEPDDVRRLRDTRFNNLFYILQKRLDEPGLLFEYRGAEVMDNMPVYLVDIIDSENRVITAYFHQNTKLPVRQDWVWRDEEIRERNEEVTRFSRYREVDGIQWPHQLHRERNGDKIYEQFMESVRFNEPLDDKLFAVPDENTRP